MTGRSAEERAVVHMMQRRGEQKIVDAIGAYFHHPTMGFGPEVELDQNKVWGEAHLQKTLDGWFISMKCYKTASLSRVKIIPCRHYRFHGS